MKSLKKSVIVFMIILEDVAKRIFKQYPDLDEIFVTSDGQGFRKENDAIQHGKYLEDKKVKHFVRSNLQAQKELEDKKETNPTPPKGKEENKEEKDEDEIDRKDLLKQYAELFGKEAPTNIKTETLMDRINEALADQ